jgi:Arc/MetJ family transcription regulator
MRTNIDIDDKLLSAARRALGGNPTKKKTIEEALKLLDKLHKQSYIKNFRGKLKWQGNLDRSRID